MCRYFGFILRGVQKLGIFKSKTLRFGLSKPDGSAKVLFALDKNEPNLKMRIYGEEKNNF